MWTVAEIMAKIRKLSGRPTAGHITDTELLKYLNNFYVYILPEEVGLVDLDTWYDISMFVNVGEYALSDDEQKITSPFTIDGKEKKLYWDATEFFRVWPRHLEATADKNEPEQGLIYGRKFYARPIPDKDGYTARFAVGERPTAFPDTPEGKLMHPEDDKWGAFIAYGAAIDIQRDAGEDAEAQVKLFGYNDLKNNITRKQIYHFLNVRSKPRP